MTGHWVSMNVLQGPELHAHTLTLSTYSCAKDEPSDSAIGYRGGAARGTEVPQPVLHRSVMNLPGYHRRLPAT